MSWVIDTPHSFSCTYEAGPGYLRGTWHTHPTDAALRVEYTSLLATARRHGDCCYWLLDLRQRAWAAPATGRWFAGSFAETARAVLGRPVYVAYVVGADQAALCDAAAMQAIRQGSRQHELHLAFFATEQAARTWLAERRALDPLG